MIRNYVLHLEFHKGYWPQVTFKRAPYVGQRCTDAGVPGHLVACKECSGQGYLHQPDSMAGLWPEPPAPLSSTPDRMTRINHSVIRYALGDVVFENGTDYMVEYITTTQGRQQLSLIRLDLTDKPVISLWDPPAI